MAINNQAGEIINLQEAEDYVNEFRKKFPNEIKATSFDATLIQTLLDQADCVKLKIYYGYDVNTENLAPVLVAVDSNGNDLTAGILLERGEMCPPTCDFSSALMK